MAATAVLVIAVPVPAAGPAPHARLAAAVQAFDAVDLGGRRWTARDLRGRVTLIDFWATWCAPCLAEVPRLAALRTRHGRDRFEVLGVSLDVSDRRTLVSWLRRQRVDWPQFHDGRGRSGPLPRAFGVVGIPMTVLLDASGHVAAVNLRGAELEAAVERLLAAPGDAGEGAQ